MENLEYILLNEKINIDYTDISNTRDIKVIEINDITHKGKSILDRVVKSQYFNLILTECQKQSPGV